jgi:5-methylcytosine-specific restriction endonuclease McrA
MGRKNVIPVRLSDNLYNLIKDYASFLGVSNSEALRDLIREGLLKKSYLGLIKRWQEKAKKRDPFIEMRKCEKCGNKEQLKLYHIDGNVRNMTPENLVILCEACINKLQKSMREYNPKEKFAAWFFYS